MRRLQLQRPIAWDAWHKAYLDTNPDVQMARLNIHLKIVHGEKAECV